MGEPRLFEESRERPHDIRHYGDFDFCEITAGVGVLSLAAEQTVNHRVGHGVGYLYNNIGLADFVVFDAEVNHTHHNVVGEGVVELAVTLFLNIDEANAAVQSEHTREVGRHKSRVVLENALEHLDLLFGELFRGAEIVFLDGSFFLLLKDRLCAAGNAF